MCFAIILSLIASWRCTLESVTSDFFFLFVWLKFAESLWLSSAVSVFLAVVFVGICSVMAITAIVKGETVSPKLVPQLDNGTSFFDLFTAVPVIVTAFTFHFNGKRMLFFPKK